MKKLTGLLLVALLLAGCAAPAATVAPATATPTPTATATATPSPTATPTASVAPTASAEQPDVDLATLLGYTRKEVSTFFGAGKPTPYGDLSDYNESAYLVSGFPVTYEDAKGLMVFFDGKPMADDAAPYYCTEDPADKVLGLLLPPKSDPYNVRGVTSALTPENLATLSSKYNAQIEHVDGMYEYYKISANDGTIQYTWVSDNADMSESSLYVQTADADSQTEDDKITGLVLAVPALPEDKLETIGSATNSDDTYRIEAIYDGIVHIYDERVLKTDSDAASIAAKITSLNAVESTGIKVKKDSALSKKFTYPVWRVTYTTGANEDTRTNLDIYIQTDGMDYRFHTDTPSEGYNEYEAQIETWIQSLSLQEQS